MLRSLYPNGFETGLATSWQAGIVGGHAARLQAQIILDQARSAGDVAAEACAAVQIAWFCFKAGDIEVGLEHASLARRLFHMLGSARGEAAAGALAAWLLLEGGLSEAASQDAAQALAVAEADGDPTILALATNVLGVVSWSCRQLDQALALCDAAVTLALRVGDAVTLAWWRVNLACVQSDIGYRAQRENRHADAERALATAIAINQQALEGAVNTGDRWCQHLALCNAAEYLAASDRVEAALDHLARCDPLAWTDHPRSQTHYLYTRANVLLRAGRPEAALRDCEGALRNAMDRGDAEAKAHALKHLSEIHESLGDHAQALSYFKRYFAAHEAFTAESAQRLARMAGLRYETRQLRQQAEAAEARAAGLMKTAQSDPLTGLANRRGFDEAQSLIGLSQSPYAVAMINLDHFKRINDRFSHQVGDDVLKAVATVLAEFCRPGDLAARLGGEEFAILIEGVELGAATERCRTLQRSLAAVPWLKIHPGLTVTASIGVAASNEVDTSVAALNLADRRLYRAKAEGRNRVVGTPTPPIKDETAECAGEDREFEAHIWAS